MSTLLPQLLDASPIWVHELDSLIKAGFPSPAEDLGATRINVFDKLIVRPAATFVMRVSGDSMIAYKIFDGDVIVIDKGVKARHGHIVVAHLDNDFLVKCLYKKKRGDQASIRQPHISRYRAQRGPNAQRLGRGDGLGDSLRVGVTPCSLSLMATTSM